MPSPTSLRSFIGRGAVLLLLAVGLVACDSTTPGVDPEPDLPLTRVEDLPADPPVSTGQGRPTGTGRYTLFSLRDSSIVLRSSIPNRADSASTQWDIAFQSTNILINGGTSGPGDGAAYVARAAFEAVDAVDTSELITDDAETGAFAIPPGSGNGWYNYNPETRVVSPIPGRTIVVRTADGEAYAKIRILSYYEGAPDNPAESDAPSRHYTFEYVLQPNGTAFE